MHHANGAQQPTQPGGIHGPRPARLAQPRPVALGQRAAAGQLNTRDDPCMHQRWGSSSSGSSSKMRLQSQLGCNRQTSAVGLLGAAAGTQWRKSPSTGSPPEAGPPPLERVPLEAVPAAGGSRSTERKVSSRLHGGQEAACGDSGAGDTRCRAAYLHSSCSAATLRDDQAGGWPHQGMCTLCLTGFSFQNLDSAAQAGVGLEVCRAGWDGEWADVRWVAQAGRQAGTLPTPALPLPPPASSDRCSHRDPPHLAQPVRPAAILHHRLVEAEHGLQRLRGTVSVVCRHADRAGRRGGGVVRQAGQGGYQAAPALSTVRMLRAAAWVGEQCGLIRGEVLSIYSAAAAAAAAAASLRRQTQRCSLLAAPAHWAAHPPEWRAG